MSVGLTNPDIEEEKQGLRKEISKSREIKQNGEFDPGSG